MGNILSNGILSVEIAEMGAYTGSRFDWTGFITQVTLEQGKHTFCVPESLIPGQGSGGRGLCNEFGISRAIGYDEVPVGGWFPKPGVGLLQRRNLDSYSFMGDYERTLFVAEVEASSDSITYTVQPMECNGYSMLLTKRIAIHQNTLTIDYALENKGTKTIETEEYIHNFIGIDGNAVGVDYELRLPGVISIEKPESSYTSELLLTEGERLSWKRQPDRPFYCMLSSDAKGEADFNWELIHKPSGVGLREIGDFPISQIALWGVGHVISPEVFVNISLLPRQSKHWRRSYEFFKLS
ncbi:MULTISPECIES: hypothetical protein [Paenibacillus]|uniref:Aldose 1-epimerase n=1 Tax=Paenibacillus agri TaxID=2744309 RepID=A0A850ESB5_9BACL|nr:hypothetical protein [Paenibacillus agri]NUU63775.1 hypothetical protein [Paenibacillus agri]